MWWNYAVFFIFGLVGIFRFNGYRVDPSKQTIQKIKKGLFSTRKGEVILFNELNYVQFVREVVVSRSGRNRNRAIYFYVYIILKKGAGKKVFSGGLLSGRVCSERLAKAVNVDLHDDSDPGKYQIRKPDELDKTVYEKLHQHFSLRIPPNKPLRMHTRTQLSFDTLIIESPRFNINNLGPLKKALWVLFAIFGILTAVALYFEEDMLTLFAAIPIAAMIFALLRSEIITLTKNTLLKQTAIGIFKRTQQIPLSGLEELYISKRTKSKKNESDMLFDDEPLSEDMNTALNSIDVFDSVIIARSDRKSIVFGRILSYAELDYILYQMERWIR